MSVILKSGSSSDLAFITPANALKVDSSGVTQPVSFSGSVPVTGTFWQATQPVSIATMPSTPVTGTFWQATQPISGTVTANIGTTNGIALDATLTGGTQKTLVYDGTNTVFTAAHPGFIQGVVTGTFWQATQPVSGTVTATQATGTNLHVVVDAAPTTAVTGAFFQAIQPVSIVASVAVTGTFFQATQPISASSLPLPANAAQETGGNLATIATAMTSGTAKTQTVSGTGTVQDVNAKAVQGANFAAVQQPKDAGRVIKVFSATFTPATAETLVTLTPISDGVAGIAATSFAVTAGKRFRIQCVMLSVTNTTAAIRGSKLALRMTSTGAITATSPLIASIGATTSVATINLSASQAQGVPDGIELSGTMQFGMSANGTALAGTSAILIGYEY